MTRILIRTLKSCGLLRPDRADSSLRHSLLFPPVVVSGVVGVDVHQTVHAAPRPTQSVAVAVAVEQRDGACSLSLTLLGCIGRANTMRQRSGLTLVARVQRSSVHAHNRDICCGHCPPPLNNRSLLSCSCQHTQNGWLPRPVSPEWIPMCLTASVPYAVRGGRQSPY